MEENTSTNIRRTYRKRLRPSELRTLWISRFFVWIVILLTLFPTIWVFAASMSRGDSFFLGSVFPKEFALDNYKGLFTDTNFPLWLLNSFKVSTGASIFQLVLTATAAYAFSRMRFPGRKYGLMSLLLLQIFPSAMSLSAIYAVIYRFDLIDNMGILIVILAGGSAYNIWLLKNYIDKLPRELDEAAVVDGAGHLQVFWRIILPLAMPMLVVIFLFTFIGVYSEFMISSIVAQSPENYTLPVGLRTFINNQFSAHWTLFSAAAVVSSLPIMVMFMLLQKFIQGGLAAGAVKG
ncbi:MAG: sugar ABC transporter permease [Clostridia bacterium]|nr:sugar ABC transporter permease [Clostridia bacterium]